MSVSLATKGLISRSSGSVASQVWSYLTASMNTSGSIGKRLSDDIDATISSRSSQSSVNAIPTDPLLSTDTRLDHLDADIGSRLPTSGYTAPDNATIASIKTDTTDILSAIGALVFTLSPSDINAIAKAASIGNVRQTIYPATVQNITRQVAIDADDHVVFDIRAQGASDWTAPIASYTLYYWYHTLTDTEPYKLGEMHSARLSYGMRGGHMSLFSRGLRVLRGFIPPILGKPFCVQDTIADEYYKTSLVIREVYE